MSFVARIRLVSILALFVLAVVILNALGYYGRPVCPWLQLTGTYCPACGGERALGSLAHGQVAGALRDNALVVVALPLTLLWLWQGYRGKKMGNPYLIWSLFGLALAYSVLRNVPALDWLAPD